MPTLAEVQAEIARRKGAAPAAAAGTPSLEAVQAEITRRKGVAPAQSGGWRDVANGVSEALGPVASVANKLNPGAQLVNFAQSDRGKEIGSGLVEGVSGFAEFGNKINPVRAAMDYGERKLGEWGVLDAEKVAKMQGVRNNHTQLIQPYLAEPDPEYATERKAAQFVGAQLLPDLLTGGTAAIPTSVGTGILSSLGDTAGRALSEEVFPGNSWTGEAPPSEDPNNRTWYDYARSWTPGPADVAGFIGGAGAGAAPTIVKSGAEAAAHSLYKDEPPVSFDPKTKKPLPRNPDYIPSEQVWDASQRQGIPSTAGSLGNKKLASWEQNIAMQPFGGGRTSAKMNHMNYAMERRLTGLAKDARDVVDPRSGQIIPGGAKDFEGLPQRILTAAKEDAVGATNNVTFPLDKMEKKHGPKKAVDVSNTVDEFDNQLKRPSPRDRDALQGERDKFQQAKTSVLDKATEKSLQAELNQKQYWLDHVNNEIANGTKQYGKRDVVRAQKELDAVNAAIEKNRGVPYDWLKREKSGVYEATDPIRQNGKGTISDSANRGVGDAIRKDQLAALEKSGTPAAEADAAFKNYGRDMIEDPLDKSTGTVPRLNEVAAKEGPQGYDWLVEKKMQYPERFQLMQRGADKHANWLDTQGRMNDGTKVRQRFRQTVGDVLESTGRAKDGQVEVGSPFSGDTFTTNMNAASKSPEMMEILSNGRPDLAKDITDMVTIGKGARSRGREVNASRTQTHNILSRVLSEFTNNGLLGVPKSIYEIGKGATVTKAADMLLSSEWLPRAVVKGVSEDWKKKLGTRAAIGGNASAVNSSMADQFGGPR